MSEAPIPAATVLLLRDEPAFEVLMIARHENSSFAGGALVFPGGRVDPGDRQTAWRDHADGLSSDDVRAAAQIAAIREAFEETGVLLARGETGAMASREQALALSEWRAQVEQNDSLFFELIRREKLRLACDALRLFAHWVAPPGLHRRFDTLFFAARFPPGQEVLEDGAEATEALWIAPRKAIDARSSGARKIIFPTARNLELLGVSRTTDEVFASAARRLIAPVMPVAFDRGGKTYLKIPEGLGYPVVEEPLETAARH